MSGDAPIDLFGAEVGGIPEFYKGKSIFITGGTGFMGKILIEKLLRSCPDVGKIYMLTRPKRGLGLQERVNEFSTLALFEKLMSEQPEALKNKLIPISGDVALLELGLSLEDAHKLINNVSIVFHVAATVRFDQPLKEALLMNTRGTREMCRLVLKMKQIECVMHVSTAYTHCHRMKVIGEKMYKAEANWAETIQIAETMDVDQLQVVAKKIMAGHPNTYTFTKSLAENVVHDLLNDKVANIVLRPSIVVSTYKDPIPGWIDNFNGPVGLMTAAGTGLVRINLVNDVVADFVAADIAIKSMIIAVWKQIQHTSPGALPRTQVYNCSSNGVRSIRMSEFIENGKSLAWEVPLSNALWHPSSRTTANETVYYIFVILFHLFPAVILDGLLKLFNQKPMLVKIQRRIYNATTAIKVFLLNEWTFENDLVLEIEDYLSEKDKPDFAYDVDDLDVLEFFRSAFLGGKKYLLKENMDDFDKHYKRFVLFYYLDMFLNVCLIIGASYIFFYTIDVPNLIYSLIANYIHGL